MTDVVVLVVATVVGLAAYEPTVGYSLFVPFVVYHFFLFCNVFRIRRRPELIWGAVFVCHSVVWIFSGSMSLGLLFSLQSVFTVVVLIREIRHTSYHGVFSRRLNPDIEDYLNGKI